MIMCPPPKKKTRQEPKLIDIQHEDLEGGLLRLRGQRGVPAGPDVRPPHRGARRRAGGLDQLLPKRRYNVNSVCRILFLSLSLTISYMLLCLYLSVCLSLIFYIGLPPFLRQLYPTHLELSANVIFSLRLL